ncbi:hypothetical protein BH11ACT8_BH11ACT8_16590 [soil metagenome]
MGSSTGDAGGRHTLGPHVVGTRIVVRRVLPGETGPSGGPALTDLLGVCLGWADGICVVKPAEGPPVAVPISTIVSGKPVPPRASVRARVPAARAQRHGFALFPDLETAPVGDWVLRDSATATARRAHSVLAFGPSGVADDVEQVLAHYRRPIAAVLTGSAEDQRLVGLGWVPESNESDTLFQVAGVASLSRALRGAQAPGATLEEDGDWVRVRLGERATAYAAYGDDWVGLAGIEVSPAHRRQGLARAVIATLVEWGAEHGATTAYLQVLGDNEPALALYESLGFRTHHTYRYLTPG